MQFEMNHKVGTDYSTVRFGEFKIHWNAIRNLMEIFYKLGGDHLDKNGNQNVWTFPSYITSQVIEEIIHNTCFVCGGLMKDGQAIQNGEIRVPEEDVRGGYIPYVDTTNHSLIKVRKCSSCGHSHT